MAMCHNSRIMFKNRAILIKCVLTVIHDILMQLIKFIWLDLSFCYSRRSSPPHGIRRVLWVDDCQPNIQWVSFLPSSFISLLYPHPSFPYPFQLTLFCFFLYFLCLLIPLHSLFPFMFFFSLPPRTHSLLRNNVRVSCIEDTLSIRMTRGHMISTIQRILCYS